MYLLNYDRTSLCWCWTNSFSFSICVVFLRTKQLEFNSFIIYGVDCIVFCRVLCSFELLLKILSYSWICFGRKKHLASRVQGLSSGRGFGDETQKLNHFAYSSSLSILPLCLLMSFSSVFWYSFKIVNNPFCIGFC